MMQKNHHFFLNYDTGDEDTEELKKKHISKSVNSDQVLRLYSNRLSEFEQNEIRQYRNIYFIGAKDNQNKFITNFNNGYDDEKGAYIYNKHDHIAYRYEILKQLGRGAFGNVFKTYDHKRDTKVALKVIRNKSEFFKPAMTEIEILKTLKEVDKEDKFNFVHMKNYFIFRNHVCITFELLTINLLNLIEKNNYRGFSYNLVQRFTYSIIKSLCLLSKLNIIHSDLKPENIVLKTKGESSIKICDFGSSCYENKTCYTYIQSRYYRAPEVITQSKYGKEIDMWSLGCIIYELACANILFKGHNKYDQLICIMECLHNLPQKLLDNLFASTRFIEDAKRLGIQFLNHSDAELTKPGYKIIDIKNYIKNTKRIDLYECGKKNLFRDDKLKYYGDYKDTKSLIILKDFISNCLIYDPERRMKPKNALMHQFLNVKEPKRKYILRKVEILNKSYLTKLNQNISINEFNRKLTI